MKKTLKKALLLAMTCFLFAASINVVSGIEQSGNMPRLTGIDLHTASISIDENDCALCGCSVLAKTGYSVSVTMALERDGVAIKTWTGSGSRVDMEKPYYVTKGHDYQVVVTTQVKTAGGLYLLSYTIESPVEHH